MGIEVDITHELKHVRIRDTTPIERYHASELML